MSSKELLGEYAKLATKLEHINETLQEMNAVDIAQLIDKIRIVERKMGLVYTLFKSSVYTVTVQHQEQEQAQDQLEEYEQEQEQINNNVEYHQERDQYHLQDQAHGQGQQQQQQQESYQEYQGQQQEQQLPQSHTYRLSSQSRRTSLYNTSDGGNERRSSQYRNTSRPSLRTSNAREEYQATTGYRSILSLSRGDTSSRWSQALAGRDPDNYTNRPRYH
ncbi:DASH complex subunit Dad3-domain-containing protein [Gamsiella multidivaricata]|uniref:DASH complex subunit Dad3-domain-containing protein n=1 Tax=Gamsiella multidivaricata TaxID=101098 RepID=UPI00221FB2A2|nr:DASH complex subunit Dad3-domain-containing protein [Gamsiella multidivaricata]KAG0371134.1 hypothetical protein BGZ54_010108 [Gamsiella multidivaricata]KAI7830416.1 DASH complex subunit Dad3-domain-containing protein [Gamsiella multidivaricata]